MYHRPGAIQEQIDNATENTYSRQLEHSQGGIASEGYREIKLESKAFRPHSQGLTGYLDQAIVRHQSKLADMR
jgi:hypothetical protein